MKSIIEYNNPQNLNDRSNCILMVCVDMPDMNQTYAFTHPTIEIHSSLPSSPTSCYVEYLRFIIDNYWKLPEVVVCVSGFVIQELSGTATKTPNHILRDTILDELNQIRFVTDTRTFGPVTRIRCNSDFETWCRVFALERPPTKFSQIPIYAMHRLSVMRNSLSYYERLLKWAVENPNHTEYLMFAWVYIFDTNLKLQSLYVEQNPLVDSNEECDAHSDEVESVEPGEFPTKIEAVTVCVNYAESLREVISNKLHFDRWVIVTTSYDTETQSVCEEHGLECVISDRIHEGGEYIFTHSGLKTSSGLKPGEKVLLESAPLAKGKAINDGLVVCDKTDWLIHLDADIKLPDNFGNKLRKTLLDKESLYGLSQRVGLDGTCEGSWVNGISHGHNGAIGWFQLFHVNTFMETFNGLYPEESADTWWDDMTFASGFGTHQECLHTTTATTIRPNSNPVQIQSWYSCIKKQKLD